MRSRLGTIETDYSGRGIRYQVEVWHDGLNKYQVIRGSDRHVVKQKAAAKASQWDEQWAKRAAREQAAQEKENKKELAAEQTAEAQAALDDLENVLAHALSVGNVLDWESLKTQEGYSEPKPEAPAPRPPLTLPPPPEPPPSRPKPQREAYEPELGMLDRIFAARRQEKETVAQMEYTAALRAWEHQRDTAAQQYEHELDTHRTRVEHLKAQRQREEAARAEAYREELAAWERDRDAYLEEVEADNTAVDAQREAYLQSAPDAVAQYCDLVLTRSEYPEYFPQTFELEYIGDTGLLVADYQLPAKESLPRLKEVRYVASRDEFDHKTISESQLNKLYDALLYQMALRSLHELLEADTIGAVQAIVFNGYCRATDPATGQETEACVLSIQVGRDEFERINLAAVDPKACFKSLKGVAASKLHTMTPVAPVVTVSRDDARFTDSRAIVEHVAEGDNLAAMDWEDFEHLIRELFEREFAAGGGEVRVTQASRDGGVDAVIFDPDPIRGGKIVVQAKRYTNTVGVGAVRDLYGSVMNEGAMKGILVTTSDYGPDAYSFAKDKPLTLLSGSNLLHLLEKHGHQARIDLQEAKRLAAQS